MAKRKPTNPKPTIDDICIVCDAPYAELHEVYYGKNRQNSIKHGLQERLCNYHHQHWENSPHQNPEGEFNQGLRDKHKQLFIEQQGEDEWYRVFMGRFI